MNLMQHFHGDDQLPVNVCVCGGNDDEFKTQNNLDKMQKEFIVTRLL